MFLPKKKEEISIFFSCRAALVHRSAGKFFLVPPSSFQKISDQAFFFSLNSRALVNVILLRVNGGGLVSSSHQKPKKKVFESRPCWNTQRRFGGTSSAFCF